MNNVEYIPLELHEIVGGSNKFIDLLKKNKIILAVVIGAIVLFLLSQNRNKNTVKSTTTNNTVSISKRIEANGEVKLIKKVNGKEVDLTEEDLKMIENAETNASNITVSAKNAANDMKVN